MENNFDMDAFEKGFKLGKEKAKILVADLQQQLAQMTQDERKGFMEALRQFIC
jgi:hypothetical protein